MTLGFATPISLCVQRRNPVRVPRRDILVVATDTPTLALTVYQQDTDTAPLDVSAATFTLSLYRERDMHHGHGCWDYGFWHGGLIPYIVTTFQALPVDPTNGRVDIALVANAGQWIVGRFEFELTMSYAIDYVGGIGVLTDDPQTEQPIAAPNYAQGNYTILSGIIDLPPGANIAIVQQSTSFLGGIGVLTGGNAGGNYALGSDGQILTGSDGQRLTLPGG